MNGTQLKMGHNTDIDLDKWRVEEDTSDDHAGVYLNLPMTCYMAGGNVNAGGESFVTKVTYFVGIPGK